MAEKKPAKKTAEDKALKVKPETVSIEPTADAQPEKPIETTDEPTEAEAARTTKAGKRSAKAIKEAEEAEAKETRKATGDTTPVTPEAQANKQGPAPKTRPRIERRGKAYRKAAEQLEVGKAYTLEEALKLAGKTSVGTFDATVELHVNLGVDPRQADQNIRATVALPHGTGKKLRIAVFAPADQHASATKAGADYVGEEDFLQKLDKEELDFDILISTPQLMAKLSKYARMLGPRGLMPNPKSGTVTTNIAKAIAEAKAGRVEYRIDKQGIVHQGIGKVSFKSDQLFENAKAVMDSIRTARPANIKGTYIKNVTVTTTMGPGITVDLSSL